MTCIIVWGPIIRLLTILHTELSSQCLTIETLSMKACILMNTNML